MPGIVQFGPELLWLWVIRSPLRILRWALEVFVAVCQILLGEVFTDVEDIIDAT